MNTYYGPGIRENQYAAQWLKVFEKRTEGDADLLFHIVLTDSIDEEDKVIGCQILVGVIRERKLWVNEEIVADLVENISDNISRISEWFEGTEPVSWIDSRRKAIMECIQKIVGYQRIAKDVNVSNDVYQIIEKQLVNGIEIEDALTAIFNALKGIAKSKYSVSPNIQLPQEVINLAEQVRASIHEYIGDDIMLQTRFADITSKIWRISHKKRWPV